MVDIDVVIMLCNISHIFVYSSTVEICKIIINFDFHNYTYDSHEYHR